MRRVALLALWLWVILWVAPAVLPAEIAEIAQPAQIAQIAQIAQTEQSQARTWIDEHGRSFATTEPGSGLTDLAFLGTWIGDARVVGLGEGTHGSHEFYRLKHRLFEYLATEKGFNLFALEANMPECERINAFVLGSEGDPRKLLADLNQWVWNNEAFLDLIVWMREYNGRHERKLRFAGFDMKWPLRAMDDVVEALVRLAPDLGQATAEAYKPHRAIDAMGVFPMWGVSFGSASVKAPSGSRKLWLSGWIRTEGITRDWAGLWLSIRGERNSYQDTSKDPLEEGSWQRLEIELEVPEGADTISFGVSHLGNGTAWFDDLVLEVDGEAIAVADADTGFESSELRGLTERPLLFPGLQASDYEVSLDGSMSRSGKQSLRLTYDARLEAAVAAAEAVFDQVESSREVLARQAEPAEVERLSQNARLVVQAMKWRARLANRDHLMAENLRWILSREPSDSRVVVSAANSHVGRVPNRMGEILATDLGNDYLAIGMTTFAGRYTAADRANRPDVYDLPPAPAQSLEYILEKTGSPRLMLDFSDAREDDENSAWLFDPRLLTRAVGGLAMDRQFAPRDPARTYDFLAFVRDTTESRRLVD